MSHYNYDEYETWYKSLEGTKIDTHHVSLREREVVRRGVGW